MIGEIERENAIKEAKIVFVPIRITRETWKNIPLKYVRNKANSFLLLNF